MMQGRAEKQQPIRILIVDDHLTVLWGLERLIESADREMVVVAKARSAQEALDRARDSLPEVIILDVGLQDEDGLTVIPELIAGTSARVLVLTGSRESAIRDRAVLAGASGVVGKEEPPANILRAIVKVYEGELWLDRSTTGRLFKQLASGEGHQEAIESRRIRQLTPRELHIARMVAREPSRSLKLIAASQHISESTLRNHLTSIYGKLGVTSRLELYVFANRHSMLDS